MGACMASAQQPCAKRTTVAAIDGQSATAQSSALPMFCRLPRACHRYSPQTRDVSSSPAAALRTGAPAAAIVENPAALRCAEPPGRAPCRSRALRRRPEDMLPPRGGPMWAARTGPSRALVLPAPAHVRVRTGRPPRRRGSREAPAPAPGCESSRHRLPPLPCATSPLAPPAMKRRVTWRAPPRYSAAPIHERLTM
eukprot:scaffold2764_cov399-Prasinococcus_capsulatus_cf.AAC.9